MRDVFVSYKFLIVKVYDLSEEALQARKCLRDVDVAPTTVTLESVPVTLHSDVPRVVVAMVRQDYDDYRRREGGHGEAELAAASDDFDLDPSF